MEIVNQLKQFGLNEKQARVYLACLELGFGSAQNIAKRAGVERSNTYYVLEGLEKQGIVSRAIKNNKQVYAVLNPNNLEKILERERRKSENTIEEKKEELVGLLPQLQALYKTVGAKPKITFYEGIEGIKNVFWQGLQKGTKEILYLWPAKDMAEILGIKEIEKFIEKRIALKIKAKVIRIKSKEIIYRKSGPGDRYLRNLRFAPDRVDFSLGIIIYENVVAIIFSKEENFALMIESTEFAKLQRELFESLWRISQPAEMTLSNF